MPVRKMKKSVSATAAYQIVPGFTRCPVNPDGNCFYTSTGFFCNLNAKEMRTSLMNYITSNKAFYSVFFETEKEFMGCVRANRRPGVWNSDICDIAPQAAAQMLKRNIIIHNYSADGTFNLITFAVENPGGNDIHLFRKSHHYEILLDNTEYPNKNIIPFKEDIVCVSDSDSNCDPCSDSDSDSVISVIQSSNNTESDNEDDDKTIIMSNYEKCLIKFS
jgi:hypothetical protein